MGRTELLKEILGYSSTTDMLYENQQNIEPFCLRLLYVKCESCFILYLGLHIYKLKNDVVDQLLRCVQLFAATWTAACQASFSFTHTQKSLSCVRLFVTPCCSPLGSSVHGIFQAWILGWVAVSFSILFLHRPPNLLKLMSIDSVMPSNHLILCRLLLIPAYNLTQHQILF